MFLSSSSKFHYGLIFLSVLAGNTKKQISTLSVSQTTGISQGYLEEIAASLRKARMVRGKRGFEGGYTLAKSPSAISLQDIFEALEGPLEVVSCTGGGCSVKENFENRCTSRPLFLKMQKGFKDTLRNIKLADAISQK